MANKLTYHDHSTLKDPTVVGPGLWYAIHSECKEAIDENTSVPVIAFLYRRQFNFPCPKCKIHFGKYLADNPPSLIKFSNPKALFHWSVDFHNSVNQRKSKAIIPYEEAEALYYSAVEFCTTTCEESEVAAPVVAKKITFKPIIQL